MSSPNNDNIFRTKVIPIMDKVENDLKRKRADEQRNKMGTFSFIAAGAAGPDGGMSSMQSQLDSLRYTGEWNSKTVEDYIEMVKKELQNQHITVTADMEKKMIDRMIEREIPKSSLEYIMRKAATSTIFYLPKAINKSPLQQHIEQQAEKRYNPSGWEKGAGLALGATTDFLSSGGFGGSWGTAAKFVGADVALSAVADKVDKSTEVAYTPKGSPASKGSNAPSGKPNETNADSDVPMIILPEYREQYKAEQAKRKEEQATKAKTVNTVAAKQPTESRQSQQQEVQASSNVEQQEQPTVQAVQPLQANQDGWTGLLSSFGLGGIQDIGNNLGYVLAMLPDILIGTLTGRTKSLGLKDNLMPIASIVAGMFVKNPLLKMVLIGMGGLNLVNKAGHEALDKRQEASSSIVRSPQTNYKVYPDEVLNSRISQPQIKGNCLIATIDRVPCTIALPDKVVDAYLQGALPLNTLANAVLAKNDQMRQMASDNYRQNEQRAGTVVLSQR